MGIHTNIQARDLFIYQVFIRNHTEEGTFKALEQDLDRIRSLGVDVVYLLPIHPIGEKNRKGTQGSPYSIKDFRAINERLGTEEDFIALIDAVHRKGMRLMMDIVFNHTAYDSILFKTRPEWFYEEDGVKTNRIGDWWDIVDFDYDKADGLETYLIETLVHYTKLGVDAFRFDVASFLPLEFLETAHQAIRRINPDTLWLSESVHGGFLRAFRNAGFDGLSEGEIYRVFDMAYDYDTQPAMEAFMKGEGSLETYIEWLKLQEAIYPKNYIKLRNLENHDFGRIAELLDNDKTRLMNWHAFTFFNKGATMLYAGGETLSDHHPDLFNKDPYTKGPQDISSFITTLANTVRGPLYHKGVYEVGKTSSHDVIYAHYTLEGALAFGVFNVSASSGEVTLPLVDGVYENRIDGREVTIEDGKASLSSAPFILHTDECALKTEKASL